MAYILWDHRWCCEESKEFDNNTLTKLACIAFEQVSVQPTNLLEFFASVFQFNSYHYSPASAVFSSTVILLPSPACVNALTLITYTVYGFKGNNNRLFLNVLTTTASEETFSEYFTCEAKTRKQ